MGDFKLTKKERITRKSEFQKIAQNGISYTTQNFVFIIYNRKSGEIRRLGISVGKKVGAAVKRNRVKRLLREFFRLNKDKFPESSDLLFIAKPGSANLNYLTLSDEILGFLKLI